MPAHCRQALIDHRLGINGVMSVIAQRAALPPPAMQHRRLHARADTRRRHHPGRQHRAIILAKRAASLNLGSGLRASIEEGTPTTIKIMRAYTGLVGDLCAVYGLTHIDALTRKKMQQLPSYCSMYDLINFATEVATHYCTEKNGRLLQAELGNFLMSEYDLENTRQAKPDFADWFVRDQTTGKNVESIAQAK